MLNYFIGLVIALFVIGGGSVFYAQNQNAPSGAGVALSAAPGEKPWIEVITSKAFATSTTGTLLTLQTGDEVEEGYAIRTDGTGVVLIHFPDGSFAKLDPQSTVTINRATYDRTSGATTVSMKLGAGGLWSKVLDLVGTDSSWNVETSNAVATVRGTAFGILVQKGKTKVVGIEHTVSVTLLSTGTGQASTTQTNVTAQTEVTVDDTHLKAIAAGKEKLVVVPLSNGVSGSNAFKAFTERAKQFDKERDTLRANTTNDEEFRTKFREQQVKDFTEQILKVREEQKASIEESIEEPTKDLPLQKEDVNRVEKKDTDRTDTVPNTRDIPIDQKSPKNSPDVPKTTSDTSENTPAPGVGKTDTNNRSTSDIHPVSLKITSDRDIKSGILEGEKAIFRALLFLSDGSTRDVTDSVAWNVINQVGTFGSPGIFRAEMNVELDEVPGAVYASYKNTDGTELNAASDMFSVHALIPLDTGTEG